MILDIATEKMRAESMAVAKADALLQPRAPYNEREWPRAGGPMYRYFLRQDKAGEDFARVYNSAHVNAPDENWAGKGYVRLVGQEIVDVLLRRAADDDARQGITPAVAEQKPAPSKKG